MPENPLEHIRYWASKAGITLPQDDQELMRGLQAIHLITSESSDKLNVKTGLMMISRLRHNHLDGLTIGMAQTIHSELRGSVR